MKVKLTSSAGKKETFDLDPYHMNGDLVSLKLKWFVQDAAKDSNTIKIEVKNE
jgi:hypothetical protein